MRRGHCRVFLCFGLASFSWAFPLISRTFSEVNLPPLTLQPQQIDFSTFDLTSSLPPAYITLSMPIALPASCATYVGAEQECTSEMTALTVAFEDCGDMFTVCRCADAQMSTDTVLDRLGRVPVGLRRYVGVVIVLNDTEPNAYTLFNGDIHFFGDCAMDTWVHEMTHAFDFASPTPQSNSSDWAAALAGDSCVPDDYSLTNRVEDFAQVGVLKTYILLHGGTLPPGFVVDCMANQLAFVDSLALYDPGPLFGNTCHIIDNGPVARFVCASVQPITRI
ncbi:hypothetical protein B0H17DRAFT_943512 [Mycena rosella]|uniref:Uncharacterized protein n=1 Tax=Mycena rosella TaxID=1033263 RepID=A0AAD7GD73_MYCRO|nr:hypothetical protein B0H17DRAFT_943512 [Mycena rosella]